MKLSALSGCHYIARITGKLGKIPQQWWTVISLLLTYHITQFFNGTNMDAEYQIKILIIFYSVQTITVE